MKQLDQTKLFARDWKTFWWYVDKALYFYGVHPRHFHRVGWQIHRHSPPSMIMLSRQITCTSVVGPVVGDHKIDEVIIKIQRQHLRKDMERYAPFVAEWLEKGKLITLAKTGDANRYALIAKGYKRRIQTTDKEVSG